MSKWIKVADLLKKGVHLSDMLCDNCHRQMKVYKGKHGKFIGCPNFNKDEGCRETRTIYGSSRKENLFVYNGQGNLLQVDKTSK